MSTFTIKASNLKRILFFLATIFACTFMFSACDLTAGKEKTTYLEANKANFAGTIYFDTDPYEEDGLYYMKSRGVGAVIYDLVELPLGTSFVTYAELSKADLNEYGGTGFVVGTLGETNENHVMFNWRPHRNDVYVSRENKFVEGKNYWGWIGLDENNFPTDFELEDNLPIKMALVYKEGFYYMFLNGQNVMTLDENQTFSWSTTTIKEIVGTKGTIKFGISTMYGKTVFSDWGYSTDPNTIQTYFPSAE